MEAPLDAEHMFDDLSPEEKADPITKIVEMLLSDIETASRKPKAVEAGTQGDNVLTGEEKTELPPVVEAAETTLPPELLVEDPDLLSKFIDLAGQGLSDGLDKLHAAVGGETTPEPEAEPKPEEEPAAEPKPEEEPTAEPEAEPKPEEEPTAEPEVAAEPEAEPEVASEPEPETAAEPEPETAAEPEPETAAEPEPETAAEPEPEVSAEPEAEPESEPESAAEPEPEVVAEPEAEPESEPEPEGEPTDGEGRHATVEHDHHDHHHDHHGHEHDHKHDHFDPAAEPEYQGDAPAPEVEPESEPEPTLNTDEEAARAYLEELDMTASNKCFESVRAQWNFASDINEDNRRTAVSFWRVINIIGCDHDSTLEVMVVIMTQL